MMAAAGSFAAIGALLGSPLTGAFLLMEASGLGGATLGLVLVPGLLAAGVGSLVFIGLDAWTGLGTFSLSLPGSPPPSRRPACSSVGHRDRSAGGSGGCRHPLARCDAATDRRAADAAADPGRRSRRRRPRDRLRDHHR